MRWFAENCVRAALAVGVLCSSAGVRAESIPLEEFKTIIKERSTTRLRLEVGRYLARAMGHCGIAAVPTVAAGVASVVPFGPAVTMWTGIAASSYLEGTPNGEQSSYIKANKKAAGEILSGAPVLEPTSATDVVGGIFGGLVIALGYDAFKNGYLYLADERHTLTAGATGVAVMFPAAMALSTMGPGSSCHDQVLKLKAMNDELIARENADEASARRAAEFNFLMGAP